MTDKAKTFNPRKTSALSELSDLTKNAKSIAVVDYTGMKVSQATEIRRAVRKAGGEIKVTKNTLFKLALDPSLKSQVASLSGLSAFVFSNNDEISALKVMADYAKKNSILSFKMGILGDRVMTGPEVLALANTPSKETSIGKLMFLLNYNTSKLAQVLDLISKKGVTNS